MSPPDSEDLDARIAHLEQNEQRLTQVLELLAQREAAPAKTGRDWDAYAAVIASFIGLLALTVSGYTAYVQRQQLRAQVWPHVQLIFSGRNLFFSAINQGTGPARVRAMRVSIHGTPVQNWSQVQDAAGFTEDERLLRSSFSQMVLPAGKDFVLIQPSDSEQSRTKFRELLPGGKHEITITVCYCSVLEQCWTAFLGPGQIGQQASADDCPISAAERFNE